LTKTRGSFFLVLGLEIDRQHPQGHADLDRGEADAGGLVHRLEHVGDERLQLGVEAFDGRGDLLEQRIGNFDDFTDCHGGADSGELRRDQATGRRARNAWASVPSSR
jgi:hypothetical protein